MAMESRMMTALPGDMFTSERNAQDVLDSSPFLVEIQPGNKFLHALVSLFRTRKTGRGISPEAVKTVLADLVSVEIQSFTGQCLYHYTQRDELQPVPAPTVTFDTSKWVAWLPRALRAPCATSAPGEASEAPSALSGAPPVAVFVERKLPLSSSHGNQPFLLSFALGPVGGCLELVRTSKFLVHAKRPKSGTQHKRKRPAPYVPLTARREEHLRVATLTIAGQVKEVNLAAPPSPVLAAQGFGVAPLGKRRRQPPACPTAGVKGQHRSPEPALEVAPAAAGAGRPPLPSNADADTDTDDLLLQLAALEPARGETLTPDGLVLPVPVVPHTAPRQAPPSPVPTFPPELMFDFLEEDFGPSSSPLFAPNPWAEAM